MHIPDGYLSPQTCAVMTAAMVPVWWRAGRKVQAVVKTRHVPLLALGAAFSFVVMMFNVPIPDGTSAHAVGAGLIAVLLGPWAACIAVSVALLIQALFFGDGGLLTFPANALNMALLMPFAAYGTYRLLSRGTALTSPRRVFAAAAGGYVGINAAALAAAIELGLQPDLFHRADGTPLYSPFHLYQTIPAVMLAHLTLAGLIEAAVTGGVVSYLRKANLPLLRINEPDAPSEAGDRPPRRLNPLKAGLLTLGVLALLSPLGLLAPGGAFGEDAPADLDLGRYGLNAVPTGLQRYSDFWGRALLPGYGDGSGLQYVVSAVVGCVVAGGGVWLLAAVLRRRATRAGDARSDDARTGS